MSQSIFVMNAEGELTRMEPTRYDSEDDLQALVADHPELLGVTDASEILLVRREQAVSDSVEGGARWSLDHLFVTRDAVPVLVEVKRASDTRIRREVVGQMMDYAANGVAYWPIEQIRASFEREYEEQGIDPAIQISQFLGEDTDEESFWGQVEANLRAGRIRMLFVADQIPSELARIVEFLNEHMGPEVLAVEIQPYEGGDGLRTLVPRLIGNTERAQAKKTTRHSGPRMSREEWLNEKVVPLGAAAVTNLENAVQVIENLGAETVNVTVSNGSLYCEFRNSNNKSICVFNILHDRVQINFGNISKLPSLISEQTRTEFLDRFEEAVGPLSTRNIQGFPCFPNEALSGPDERSAFENVAMDFIVKALDGGD